MPEVLLPLFPLEVVLLPEELLPLHIFEDRYKEMIGECLAAKSLGSPGQEFGVVLAKKGEMEAVGCCARIVNLTRKYRDGRMDILTVGTRRFEVVLTNDEKPYLRGEVEFFEDETGAAVAEEADAQRAIDLFRSAMQKFHRAADMPIPTGKIPWDGGRPSRATNSTSSPSIFTQESTTPENRSLSSAAESPIMNRIVWGKNGKTKDAW